MKGLPNPLRGVLLDWDGTLLNSYAADLVAYRAMFAALGIDWGEREVRRHYSPNWHHIYRAARVPRKLWPLADRVWLQTALRARPPLLPGARRTLRWLARRYQLGLVTSGSRARVVRQLRRLGLTALFPARVCAEDASPRKPHPAPLRLALRQMRLGAEHCIYVGDAPEDVIMARRAGVFVAGVLGPFPTHRRLRAARPDVLLASVAELPALLRACKK